MLKSLILIAIFVLMCNTIYGQSGYQSHPNSYIPVDKFISFLGTVSESEEVLLRYDFRLDGVKKIKHITFVEYRLNHTLNKDTGIYEFDSYEISDEIPYFLYMTSSLKNFSHYKKVVRSRIETMLAEVKKQGVNSMIVNVSEEEYRLVIEEIEEGNKIEIVVKNYRHFYSNTPNYKITIGLE